MSGLGKGEMNFDNLRGESINAQFREFRKTKYFCIFATKITRGRDIIYATRNGLDTDT